MAKDSAAGIELGRSFHQVGTVNVRVKNSQKSNLSLENKNLKWGEIMK